MRNAAAGIYRFCRCRSGVAGRGSRAAVGDIQKEKDSFSSVGASTSSIEAFSNIGSIMISVEWPRYLALIVLLLLVVFGYCRGRSHSPAWSNIPLIALAILSIGPSVCAVILYLAYKFGLVQPGARGYSFRSFVYLLPVDFALLNWAFVPLYVVGRILAACWLSPACDVVCCSCDVSPKCSFVRFGAGNGFERSRCWPRYWNY
jgi:hypothetical protein